MFAQAGRVILLQFWSTLISHWTNLLPLGKEYPPGRVLLFKVRADSVVIFCGGEYVP